MKRKRRRMKTVDGRIPVKGLQPPPGCRTKDVDHKVNPPVEAGNTTTSRWRGDEDVSAHRAAIEAENALVRKAIDEAKKTITEPPKGEDLDKLGKYIISMHRAAGRSKVKAREYMIKAGEGLSRIRRLVKHGTWENHAKTKLGIAPRTARKYMKIYRDAEAARLGFMDFKPTMAELDNELCFILDSTADAPEEMTKPTRSPKDDKRMVKMAMAARLIHRMKGQSAVPERLKKQVDNLYHKKLVDVSTVEDALDWSKKMIIHWTTLSDYLRSLLTTMNDSDLDLFADDEADEDVSEKTGADGTSKAADRRPKKSADPDEERDWEPV